MVRRARADLLASGGEMTVRELRKKLGWTQQKMAHEAGVAIRTITYWDSGKRLPRNEHAIRFSKIAAANGIDGFAPNCPCCGRPL